MGYFKRQVTPIQLTDEQIKLCMLCVENEEQRIADLLDSGDMDAGTYEIYSIELSELYNAIDEQR